MNSKPPRSSSTKTYQWSETDMTDVPDPSDFPTPDLRALDASLRCTICGELYDGPVMLVGCGHCFCSVCVRQHIHRESDCPSCRKPTNEASFRPNAVLEEVVGAWKETRKHVLDLARKEHVLASRPPLISVGVQVLLQTPNTPSTSATPSPTRSHKRKRMNVDYVSDSDSSGIMLLDDLTPKKRHGKAPKVSRVNRGAEPSSDPEEIPLDPNSSEVIDCPVCAKPVPYNNINPHLDSGCKDVGRSAPKPGSSPAKARNNDAKNQWSSLFGAGGSSNSADPKGKGKGKDRSSPSGINIPIERLPNVSYDVLKDKQIKQLLAEQNLPLTGDRKAWIRRHTHYLIIHNATLDKASKNRSTFAELRQELKQWEDEKAKKPASTGVGDVVEYTKANDGEFKRLLQEARRNTNKQPSKEGPVASPGQREKTPSPTAPDAPIKSEDMET